MEEILNAIPHRPPFLFVDRIIEITGTKIKTTKEIRSDEQSSKAIIQDNQSCLERLSVNPFSKQVQSCSPK